MNSVKYVNKLNSLTLTLAIIKPDVVAHPRRCQAIKQVMLDNKFYFVRSQEKQLLRSEAEIFYAIHKEKFFFNRLAGFMSSGPLSAHILARHDAIAHWRHLMGPTKTFRAKHDAPDSLRARFGLTDTRNATHGSDSPETAKIEMEFFFPDFNVDDWYRDQEPSFRSGNVKYCDEKNEHYIIKDVIDDKEFPDS
ncbi:nucleoside diphosphate kinase 6-like [Asterias rubens]|uniref:nucleoside diphosphate kinase 6-like n=1 Tax=Asterias rubens TaxID=7604 RepID=UPI0014555EA9|nr:nucleoside diphosphate kinase 6-like [Asterias rubens]